MGIVLGTIDKQYLIAYRSQLEEEVAGIKMAKLSLAKSSADLVNAGTDMDPESPMIKQLEQRKARLNLLEKKLDLTLSQAETRLKMVEGQLEGVSEELNTAVTRKV